MRFKLTHLLFACATPFLLGSTCPFGRDYATELFVAGTLRGPDGRSVEQAQVFVCLNRTRSAACDPNTSFGMQAYDYTDTAGRYAVWFRDPLLLDSLFVRFAVRARGGVYEPTPSVGPGLLLVNEPGGDTKRLDQDLVVALPVVR